MGAAVGEDEGALDALDASLLMESVVLWDVNLKVAQRLHDLRQELKENVPVHSRASSLVGLAIAQAMLGQREAALQAAQEAVDLYRELAAQRADAFRPDLATSLIVLALRHHDAGDTSRAVPLAHEAIATLQPAFLCQRYAHAPLILAMVQDNLQMCDSTGQTPHVPLLQPLLPYLNGGLDDA